MCGSGVSSTPWQEAAQWGGRGESIRGRGTVVM